MLDVFLVRWLFDIDVTVTSFAFVLNGTFVHFFAMPLPPSSVGPRTSVSALAYTFGAIAIVVVTAALARTSVRRRPEVPAALPRVLRRPILYELRCRGAPESLLPFPSRRLHLLRTTMERAVIQTLLAPPVQVAPAPTLSRPTLVQARRFLPTSSLDMTFLRRRRLQQLLKMTVLGRLPGRGGPLLRHQWKLFRNQTMLCGTLSKGTSMHLLRLERQVSGRPTLMRFASHALQSRVPVGPRALGMRRLTLNSHATFARRLSHWITVSFTESLILIATVVCAADLETFPITRGHSGVRSLT